MPLASWDLVQDFRHSAVTSFSSVSLSHYFIYCEIWVRSLSSITLPKEATEVTYRVKFLEESATEWTANMISSTKAYLHIMKESVTSSLEGNQPFKLKDPQLSLNECIGYHCKIAPIFKFFEKISFACSQRSQDICNTNPGPMTNLRHFFNLG